MNWKTILGTVAILGAIATAASAASGLSVRQTTKVKGTDKEVWTKIGGFCSIKDWHPAIASCEESKDGGDAFRTLTLKDGGKIKEKLTGMSATGYTYAIVDGPLPVKDYFASFSAKPDADDPSSTIIAWSSNFMAKGKPDSEVRTLIEGIFKDGLKGIADGAAK